MPDLCREQHRYLQEYFAEVLVLVVAVVAYHFEYLDD
jgi:hypothetical protein